MAYTVTTFPEAESAVNDLDARVLALVADVAALDARLDAVEAAITALQAADTALDGRVDVIEAVPRGTPFLALRRFMRRAR